MRIALVTRRYPPECCGVGDYTARLAESWEGQGHEVTVFVASPAGRGEGRPATSDQRPERTARVERVKLDGWKDVTDAAKAIREARPDAAQIEYSNYGWSRWGFAFWINRLVHELRRAGMPVTIALHEFPLYFSQAPLQAGISLLQRAHFALLVLGANDVLTNTHERVRVLRRWFPWRRETIHYRPNSSNIPVTECSAEQRAGWREAHAPGAALVVTMFGTYHRNRNFEAGIEAASSLRREVPLALWLLGDTSLAQPAYMELLRGRIRECGLEDAAWWSGRMTPTEISQCLQASDIFVLPQPDGNVTRSGAFMAAAAHGLPVIAVRNAENQADFKHGENVWLVAANRADLIAQAMRELSGNTALRARLGSNLRALYERRFAWEVAAGPRKVTGHTGEQIEIRNSKLETREEQSQKL